jgi:predicted permease
VSLRHVFRRPPSADEVDEEIRSHLQIAAQERIAAGEDPARARAGARREFGNVTLTAEATRRVWRWRASEWLADAWQDCRVALRLARRNRGHAVTVALVLALGIGANTAGFMMLKAVFLTPLPGVDDPWRLGVLTASITSGRTINHSYPDYRYLRTHSNTFSGLAASSVAPFGLGSEAGGQRVFGELVSGNYFQVLGATARLGRTLLPSDESAAGAERVAVISDRLWRESFGADPQVVGRTIRLNAQPLTIVGVAEPRFRGSMVGMPLDIFVPLTLQPQMLPGGNWLELAGTQWLIVVGRLRPGVSFAEAAAQTEVLAARLAADAPMDGFAQRATVIPFWQSPFGGQPFMRPIVGIVSVAGVLVLVIVCANLANLALVRSVARRGEVAVRLALGASRVRLVRLLLIENLVLALPAALLGLLLARRVSDLLTGRTLPLAIPLPTALDTPVDSWVIGIAALASCASVVGFGFLPALRGTRVAPAAVIKDEGVAAGPPRSFVRRLSVVVQVALALLLLTVTGLTLRSVQAARAADPGFEPRGVVSVAIDPGAEGYDADRGRVFYQRLLDTLRAQPAIDAASLAYLVPLRLLGAESRGITVEGYAPRRDEDMSIQVNLASPDYFRTLRIAMVAGRDFDARDRLDATPVVIVNDTMAKRFWQGPANALGKRFRLGEGNLRTVVGVVRDVKYLSLNEDPTPYFYVPFPQNYRSALTIHARGSADPATVLNHVRDAIRTLDAEMPVLDAQTLEDQSRAGVLLYEMAARVLTTMGVMSLVLAAVGIFGLVSYTVTQRAHEIGIRMAIGATRRDVLSEMIRSGVRLAVIGAGVGFCLAFVATRLMVALLYGVVPTDPIAFSGAMLLVITVTLAASFVPAWRATQIQPVATLRQH